MIWFGWDFPQNRTKPDHKHWILLSAPKLQPHILLTNSSTQLWTVKCEDGCFVFCSPSVPSVVRSPNKTYARYWMNHMEMVPLSLLFNSTHNLSNPITWMAPCSQGKSYFASWLCRQQLPRFHFLLLLLLSLFIIIFFKKIFFKKHAYLYFSCIFCLTFQVSKCNEMNTHYLVCFFSILCSKLVVVAPIFFGYKFSSVIVFGV